MKTVVALILLVVSMTSAQPTRGRPFARQQIAPDAIQPPSAESAPYSPSGWKPQGAQFNLPTSQPQQTYGPPSPGASYGPPPAETTTADYEVVTSTDPPSPSKVATKAVNNRQQKPAPVQEQKGVYFVVLPQATPVVPVQQSQNLVYAYTEIPKNALVAVPQTAVKAAPLQTVPLSTYKVVYSPLTASYANVEW